MGTVVDVVTARALRHALQPNTVPGRAARELADLAREPWVLNRALNRIELGLAERTSPVGQRAREILTLALALVPEAPTARSAPGAGSGVGVPG